MLKKFPSTKQTVQKMPSFFCRELQLITVLLLICEVGLSKTVCGIFHFRFRFVFIKVYIVAQQNAWTL